MRDLLDRTPPICDDLTEDFPPMTRAQLRKLTGFYRQLPPSLKASVRTFSIRCSMDMVMYGRILGTDSCGIEAT